MDYFNPFGRTYTESIVLGIFPLAERGLSKFAIRKKRRSVKEEYRMIYLINMGGLGPGGKPY